MGCFSFKCKESQAAVNSSSFDGDAVHLFLLKDGKVIEHMFGNYDSYGRVFKADMDNSYEWNMPWSDVCNLMFDDNKSNGIAAILSKNYHGQTPTTRSSDDPNQGWGKMKHNYRVEKPFHEVYESFNTPAVIDELDSKRQEALAKLTDEDKKILGLI